MSEVRTMTDRYENIYNALSHEIWAAAQLVPGEGIVDGVARIEAILSRYGNPADTNSKEAELDELRSTIGALREEVAEWKRVASAQAELHGESESRAERLAEALRRYGVHDQSWISHSAPADWTQRWNRRTKHEQDQ